MDVLDMIGRREDKNFTSKQMGEVCFWLAIFVELCMVIIDKSAYTNPFEGQLFRLTFVLFLIKMITTKYTKKEWALIIGFGLIAMLSYCINTKDETVRLVVLIASCKGMDLRKILKFSLYTMLVGCIGIILLSVSGIYGDVAVTTDYGRDMVETRYTLGMGHPNALHCMVLMVLSLVVYLYEASMKWYHFGGLVGINMIFYWFDDSNTGMLMTMCLIIGAVFFHYCPKLKDKKIIYYLAVLLFLGCIIFSMFGAYYGNSTPLAKKIDDALNGRYKSALLVADAKITEWKLFAKPENTESFDAAYIKLFYWYGIIPAIIYFFGNIYLIYVSYRKKDAMLLVLIVTYAVYSLMEGHLVSFYLLRNYLFLFMGYYWNVCWQELREEEGYFWQVPGWLIRKKS